MRPDVISKARARLVYEQPFFATILLSLELIEDNTVATMATNGEVIRYNKEWTESLKPEEVLFVLAHETLHCVFQHMHRRGDRTPMRWNIAADYIINAVLIDEGVGRMPKGGLHDVKMVEKGGGTAEGVYNLLGDESENKTPGQPGGSLDQVYEPSNGGGKSESGTPGPGAGDAPADDDGVVQPGPVDDATLSQKEAEMRVRIVQARNAAKIAGHLSAGLERLVNDLLKSETDWKSVLRRFLTERTKTDLSYSRPKRRFLADDVYLPSLVGEKLGKIVVAVDCSGSVDEEQLAQFGAEIRAIHEDARPEEIKVIYFDTKVLHTQVFTTDDTVKLEAHGGGGTLFAPFFKEIEKDDTPPIALVVLTDMFAGDWQDVKNPGYPVLWASTTPDKTLVESENQAPFGETVYVKFEEKSEK